MTGLTDEGLRQNVFSYGHVFPLSCWKSCFFVSLINIDEQRIGREIQNIKNLIVYRNRYIDISGAENTNVSSWDTNFLCKCFLCKTGTIKFLSQKRVTQTGFRNRPSFHLNHSWNNRIQTGNKIPILHPFLVYIMKKKIKKPAIMQGWKIRRYKTTLGKNTLFKWMHWDRSIQKQHLERRLPADGFTFPSVPEPNTRESRLSYWLALKSSCVLGREKCMSAVPKNTISTL